MKKIKTYIPENLLPNWSVQKAIEERVQKEDWASHIGESLGKTMEYSPPNTVWRPAPLRAFLNSLMP